MRLGDRSGPLLERLGRLYDAYQAFYTGQTEYDLVVPFSSATAADDGHLEIRTTCDHFSYFSDDSCGKQATERAILELWKRFGLANHIAPWLQEHASAADESQSEGDKYVPKDGTIVDRRGKTIFGH